MNQYKLCRFKINLLFIVKLLVIFENAQLCYCFRIKDHVMEKRSNNVTLTNTWSVKLNAQYRSINELNNIANDVATSIGMKNLGQVGELVGHYVFTSHDKNIYSYDVPFHSAIEWSYQQELLLRRKRLPLAKQHQLNDEIYSVPKFKDPLYPDQWHLHNSALKLDCNVTGVWERNISGLGVVVAVVDDGVQWQHPDLTDNYCSEGSFDLNSDDDDPTPEPDEKDDNKHGTRCAGEIAAVANSVCGVGIAYKAKFSGIRILDGPMTDSIEATAFNKHMDVNDVYSCSWGPEDDGKTVDGPRDLAQAALKHGVVAGRYGFGSIYVVASGNGGSNGDNCNYDGYANSIYTVTIAAVDELGRVPTYSEQCTSMLACTVSSGNLPARSITTTDWTLGHNSKLCTDDHTGTSAATPLVAGMIALMLEARPCLTWRDVQYIIAMTATPLYELESNNQDMSLWSTNSAGFHHSNSHGFGLLDSWKLVNTARTWKQIPWLASLKPNCPGSNLIIPNTKNAGKLTVTTNITKQESDKHLLKTIEHILITVSVSHSSRGNLKFEFVCPSGTTSIIPPRKKDDSDKGLTDWTFSTVKCWGEKPFGQYNLIISDVNNKKQYSSGMLQKWSLTIYGSQMTSNDILERRKTIKEALSGKFISPNSNFTLDCPPKQLLLFDVTKAVSSRTLKLVALISCFFVVWAIYYSLEMAFCNEEDKENNNENSNVMAQSNYNSTTNTGDNNTPIASNNVNEGDIHLVDLNVSNTSGQVVEK